MKSTVLDGNPDAAAPEGPACSQTVVLDHQAIRIPAWVEDHASFRHWAHSDEFPERTGRVCFLAGEVWVDMSKEQVFTHNQVKAEVARALGNLAKAERLGRFFPDGVLFTNVAAGLTAQPDGVFTSRQCLAAGRVRLVEGAKEGYVELEGTPDLVLEVVSDSSVDKDNVILRDLYWRAGIREYWLIDARQRELRFDVLRKAARGFLGTRRHAGWLRSAVFKRSFRLRRQSDELGNPEFTLEVR
jgi:Uma2 family endonuclease